MTKDINFKIKGSGGGSKQPEPHIPVESPNTLQSKTSAKIVDVLCEGEIEGPANGDILDSTSDKWLKSIYFNETPIMADGGTLNFQGIGVEYRNGTTNNTPLKGYDSVDNITILNVDLKQDTSPYSFTITDTEVDALYLTIQIPSMFRQKDNGDVVETTVQVRIDVVGDNGNATPFTVVDPETNGKITGKTVSLYRKQFEIDNLYDNYGPGPWVIRAYRVTEDSGTVKTTNPTSIYSYTTSKKIKMRYPDSALVGLSIDSEFFGDKVPGRAFKIKGIKVKVPINYTPETKQYSGVWNGTFKTAYTNNPAWVLYDLMTNERYGLGEEIDASLIDKWTLYSIAQYCDENVTYIERQRQLGGGYSEQEYTQPRFTFNGVIANREQALAVINHICSVFRGYPIWSTGMVSFVQDTPKEMTRIANNSNVINGLFEYEGTGKETRTTVVKATYNNMDLFGRPEVVVVEDEQGILKYGYNPVDIVCFGCTSRAEAIRRAKYILYTNINQTEIVKFTGGLEWADTLPGEVVGVQDKDYTTVSLSGRVIDSTTTSITIDREIEIESGEEYTLYVADNTSAAVIEKVITNAPGDTTSLTWSGSIENAPKKEQTWILTKASVRDVRLFQVIGTSELEAGSQYEIIGVEYFGDKYAEVEEGVIVEIPPATNIPIGKLEPPSDINVQGYTYTDGDSQNRKYGMLISWVGSPDPRSSNYEIQYIKGDASPKHLDFSSQLSYDWRNVEPGIYTINVRAKGITGNSNWVSFVGYVMNTAVENILPPTNVRTIDDPENDRFTGPDCEIEWDASDGAVYDSSSTIIVDEALGRDTISGYKIEVYKVDDTLLRTSFTEDGKQLRYNYTYNMNKIDNSGSPIRQLKFIVYAIDNYNELSEGTVLVASNPAPDFSSTTPTVTSKPTYLQVNWTPSSDNDISHYVVYSDTNNPPTTVVGTVQHPNSKFDIHGLLYGTSYYVQIEPYDGFGAGNKSVIPGSVTPTQIPNVNIDVELEGSVEITTDSSYSGTLNDLYDGKLDTGGITIANPSGKYIQYSYKLTNYFDRVAVWSGNNNARVYFSISEDDGSTWEYFAGYNDGELTSYGTSQVNAISNYWQLQNGFNVALLPNNKIGNRVRMFFTNTNSTIIYEFVPSRILISELAAIDSLSAISANVGSITAGTLQSSDYGATDGMSIDLNDKSISLGGSYNPVLKFYEDDGYKLDINVPVKFWSHYGDETKIDGGDIYIGSQLKLAEGGKATFGDDNVVIDTLGQTKITIAPDGGYGTNDYCSLTDGDIRFYYYDGDGHQLYSAMTRIESGIAANGTTVTLPGIWRETPNILLSINEMKSYDNVYHNQSQTLKLGYRNLARFQNTWRFIVDARLQLSTGGYSGSPNTITKMENSNLNGGWTNFVSPAVTLPNYSRRLRVSASGYGWTGQTRSNYSAKEYTHVTWSWQARFNIILEYYMAGAWHSITKAAPVQSPYYPGRYFAVDFDTGTKTSNITQYRLRWQYVSSYYNNTSHRTITDGSVASISGSASVGQNGTLMSLRNLSYSVDTTTASILSPGSLNWIAIGR